MGPYILSGIVVGSIYAISALGLVLTYKSSRVFNFAHGAMAYAIAVFYYWLTREQGWSIQTAAPLTLLVFAPLLGLVLYALLFRRLTHLSPTVRLVSTVGLWVALPALVRLVFPVVRTNIENPQGLVDNPVDPRFWKVFGTYMDANQFTVIVCAVAITVVTSLALRYTSWGLATRASVDHPVNASIAGVNTERVRASSWMAGAFLAGISGVLLAPFVGLLETQFTLLLVASFAAVVIGRLTSLPLTFAGAILVGLLQQLWVKIQPETGLLSKGVSSSIPFLVMLVFLIAYSFSKSGLRREMFAVAGRRTGGAHGDAPPLPPAHGWRRAAGPLAAVVVLALVPVLFDGRTILGATFDSFYMTVFNQGLALAIIFLSYTLVTGEGGMISLSQITFAGIGAFAGARLAAEAGFPVWAALLVGACIAIPFGLLVALPSLRIGDIYLAMLTIGFALVVESAIWTRDEFDNNGSGVASNPPFGLSYFGGTSKFLGITLNDRIWLYLILGVVFGLLGLLIVNLKRATTGLVFASIRSSETASSTTGISIVRAKLIIFAVSAFVAGLGGALYSTTIGTANAFQFTVTVGIVWLAIVVTWGVRSVVGALLAGVVFGLAPQKLSVILILTLVIVAGGLIATLVSRQRHRTSLGVLAIAAIAIATLAASGWMWDHVSTVDAVNTILVLVSLAFGIGVGLRIFRSESLSRPAAIGLGIVVAALGVVVAAQFVFGGITIDEITAKEVPIMMFGLGAIVLAREPRGVVYQIVNEQRLRQLHDEERDDEARILDDVMQEVAVPRVSTPTTTRPPMDAAASEVPLLEADDVTVRFGGVVALDMANLRVPRGGTVGLVGPNGAGKTTLFGVLSGLLRPRAGVVRMNGADVTNRSPQSRAMLGLSRTFQRMELFTELTVREHLVVARRVREGRQSFPGFFRDLSGFGERISPTEAEAIDEILELVGLEGVADRPTESLPLGTGRLVEVARALASDPTVMLLDEPSSGLDLHETEQLGDALRRVREERGTAFVLVEHNFEFVLDLSDRVTVLDFGKVLIEGTPDEVRHSSEVQAAYLGATVDGATTRHGE